MATGATDIFNTVTKQFKGFMVVHSEDKTIKMVKGYVDKLSKVIEKLDKYLKTKGIDAEAIADKAQTRGKALLDEAKTKTAALKEDVKSKGFKTFAKEKTADIGAKLRSMFKSDKEAAAPPQEGQLATPEGLPDPQNKANPFAIIIDPIKALTEKITKLTEVSEDTLELDKEAKADETKAAKRERFNFSFLKRKERIDARAKEVEDEKAGAKTKGKKGAAGGIFGSMLGGLGSLAGGAAMTLTSFLGKGLLSVLGMGLKAIFTRLIPGLVPILSKGAGAIAGSLLKGAGKALWGGIKFAATRALPFVGKAALVAGKALLTTPVGLAVVGTALAVYGGYKLYKHLTRNDAGSGVAGDLTRLRLLTYGYNDTVKSEYNKVFALEGLMGEYVSGKNGTAQFKNFDADFRKKVSEIFEVTTEEKDKFKTLNVWFMQRFLPSYKAFMSAFYSSTKVAYIDDIDKLSDQENFDLASRLTIPLSIYDNKHIPYFSNTETPVSKDQVDDLLAIIKRKTQDKLKGEDKNSAEAKNAENKKKAQEAAAKQKLSNNIIDKNNEVKPPPDEPPKAPAALPDLNKGPLNTPQGAAGQPEATVSTEVEPKEPTTSTTSNSGSADQGKPLDTAIGNIKKADGPLLKGDHSLEGMRPNDIPREKILSLEPNVLTLFGGMTKEYKELTGKDIQVNEAFRTREDQAALYKEYGKGRAAPPGSSLHEHGLAIDVARVDTAKLEKMGLLRKYGFTRPVGGETWHLEPAGVSLNPREARDNPSVREARILGSVGRGGGGYGSVPKDPKGGRNIAMQRKLFDREVGETVDVAKLKKEQEDKLMPTGSQALPTDQAGAQGAVETPATPVTPKISDTQTTQETPTDQVAAIAPKLAESYSPKSVQPPTPPDVYNTTSNSLEPSASETTQPGGKPNNGSYTGNSNMKTSDTSGIEQIIRKAAQLVGINPDTLLAFAKVESSLRVGVKNKRSSATGLFQIVGTTWDYLVAKYGRKFGVPANASPQNPEHNSIMGAAYAKENLQQLRGLHTKAGIREDTALYLMHHFGPSGGSRIMRAYMSNPDSDVRGAVSVDSYNSNIEELRGKTVRQYIDYLNNKLSKAGSSSSASQSAPSQPQAGAGGEAFAGEPTATPSATNPADPSLSKPRDPLVSPMQPTAAQTENAAKDPTFPGSVQEAPKSAPIFTIPEPDAGKPQYSIKHPVFPGSPEDLANKSAAATATPVPDKPQYSVKSLVFPGSPEDLANKSAAATPIPDKPQYSIKHPVFPGSPEDLANKSAAATPAATPIPDKPQYSIKHPVFPGSPEDLANKKAAAQEAEFNPNVTPGQPQITEVSKPQNTVIQGTVVPSLGSNTSEFAPVQGRVVSNLPPANQDNTPVTQGTVVQPGAVVDSGISSIRNAGASIMNSATNAIGGAVSSAVGGVNQITGTVSGGINNATGAIKAGIGGVGNTIGGIGNAIGSSIGGIGSALGGLLGGGARAGSTTPPPPQPGAALSLDKTESILSNMDGTLTQIKGILESINSSGKGMGAKGDATSATGAQPQPNANQPATQANQSANNLTQTPFTTQKTDGPSPFGMDMSRRSVLSA